MFKQVLSEASWRLLSLENGQLAYASNSQYLTDGFGEKYGVSASMY